jgi:acyl-CoA thioesterase
MNSQELNGDLETRIRKQFDNVPFAQLLGIELESIEPGVASVALRLNDNLKQNNGVIHGGVTATLIDTALALAILSILPESDRVTTVDLTISYLRPLTDGKAKATARVIRAGNRLITASAEVCGEGGSLAATALSTYIKLATP